MSAVVEEQVESAKKSKDRTGGPSLPQVNLLPPEVRADRRLRGARGWFGLAVVLAVLAVAAGWGYGWVRTGAAQDDIVAEQQRTTDLLKQKAQFSAVTPVLAELMRVDAAQKQGSSTEILWSDYLGAITAVLPPDVTVATLTVQAANPMEALAAPTDPLATPSIATIAFTGTATTVPDAAAWADALDAVPGFSSAWVGTVQRAGTDGAIYYDVTSTIQMDATALAKRSFGGEQR